MIGFWFFMLATVLLIPGLMVIFGRRFQTAPPKEINGLYGYRTRRSMQNRDTWEFAHRYFGALWCRWGLVLLPASVIPMFFVLRGSADAMGLAGSVILVIQLIPMLIPVFLTERALQRSFDDFGVRK